ncbi:hypothetical protein [Pseudomonas sp. NA-150]|uniref:hypothetical protein n=1 Tax=Pseudomonas sp. NA-150 TaxID=3367525 RepID=UPI0037CC7985
MSSAQQPYFHLESLRQRFDDDLKDAVRAEAINDQESQWLRTLLDTSATATDSSDAPRVDRLLIADPLQLDAEVATALLISHTVADDKRVYLSTLSFGVEQFDDREQLLECLVERYDSISRQSTSLEYEKIDGDPFIQCRAAIIDQQAGHLLQLSRQLLLLPSLQATLCHALKPRLDALTAGTSTDPQTRLLQIVQIPPASLAATEVPAVVGLQTLLDAALDECSGETLDARLGRYFLSTQGLVLDSEQSLRYRQALSSAVQALSLTYEEQLAVYWDASLSDGRSRREYATEWLAQAFRLQLLTQFQSKMLTVEEFRRLRSLQYLASEHRLVRLRVEKLSVEIDGQEPVKLAGMFLISFLGDTTSTPLLYSSINGLSRLTGRDALDGFFKSAAGSAELLDHSSLNDHAMLRSGGALHVRFDAIERELFVDRADSVIALQKRNLAFALKQPRQDRTRMTVMIDDALDIRPLLDHRLLRTAGGGRWSEERVAFDKVWLTPYTPSEQGETAADRRVSVPLSWMDQADSLDKYNQWVRGAHPGVAAWVRDELNRYLAVICATPLDVRYVQVQLLDGSEIPAMESPMPEVVDLIDLTLELISGRRTGSLADASRALLKLPADSVASPIAQLTPALLNLIVPRIRDRFTATYGTHVQRFYTRPFRDVDTQLDAGALSSFIREDLLRLELSLQRRLGKVDSNALDMLEEVLNLPERSLRRSLGTLAAEVYQVSVIYDPLQPAVRMSNAFILNRPAQFASKWLFWSPLQALQVFDTRSQLEYAVGQRLTQSVRQASWLGLFQVSDQHRLRVWLKAGGQRQIQIATQRVDGHFIRHLQQMEWTRQYRGIEQAGQFATRHRLDATSFANLLGEAEADDCISQALSGLSLRIQNELFKVLIPDWLRLASTWDLLTFKAIFQRFYLTNDPTHDFMVGIPSLHAYSRDCLLAELSKAFPSESLDPDNIQITFKRYITSTSASTLPGALGQTPSMTAAATITYSESLTDYAINRFFDVQDVVLSVSTLDKPSMPAGLTSQYVITVVRQLDIGEAFRRLLAQKFDPADPGFMTRRNDFIRQAPALLLLKAFAMKLTKELTATAYRFVERVADMPDNIARLPIDDQDIVLRPLQLIASPDMVPDSVSGLYLIGPSDAKAGPQILYAILHEGFSLKEYADQDALLKDLRESEILQTLVLQRVEPGVRARYASGGFSSVHLSWFSQVLPSVSAWLPGSVPGPVTLDTATLLQGNALHHFFTDTVKVFQDLIKQYTMSSREANQSSFRYVMTLFAEQALSFLPGKLGMAVAAWQSQTLVREALTAAANHRWGKAVSEFSAALGVLAASRVAEDAIEHDNETETETAQATEEQPESQFTLRLGELLPELQTRLQQFEVDDLALSDLQRDELFNVYRDPRTLRRYAAVDGKVYQVDQAGPRLRIIRGQSKGPWIKLKQDTQQWALDIRLRGGGGALTRVSTAASSAQIELEFIVEAEGMHEIRLNYINKARRIGQAHLQAKRYLETAMDNLNTGQSDVALNAEATRIIAEFFGVQTPSAALIGKIQQLLRTLFAAMTDPSLSPWSSSRFVVGTNRSGYQDTTALVVKGDPLQRIYLSERFFRMPAYRLKAPAPGQAVFNEEVHYRAATLIHEVSHLACDTHDIAYVESSSPYLDLLADQSPHHVRIKQEIERLQQRTLSHRTQPDALFQTFEDNNWRDLKDEDGSAKQAVLRLTGERDLDDARRVFLSDGAKRSDVILSNADSLTLLILLLGRESFLSVSRSTAV